MSYRQVLQDGTNPGGNLGVAFAANINATQIVPQGAFLDHLILGLQGTVGTAPVTLKTALLSISQFTLKAGQETRLQLSGQDLLALAMAVYGKKPFAWQNTDNTGNTFILGLKIPVFEKIDPTISYTYSFTYAAQTNFTSPTLALTAVYLNNAPSKSPIIAVPIPFTTPGATGTTSIGSRLTNLGQLAGLLLFQTTAPADGAVLYDIQRVQIVESGKQTSLLHTACPDILPGISDFVDGGNFGKALQSYSYWDFSDEPFDVKTAYLEFIADIEVISEATRLIPIIYKS